MLNLYCALAAQEYRLRMAAAAPEGLLVVVPNEISAFSWQRKLEPAGTGALVRSFEELVDELVRQSGGFSGHTISPAVCRAIYRDLLDATPEKYDYLVGKNSVPRLTQGVLSRIIASAEALTQEEPGAELNVPESPRRRQLKVLLDAFNARLEPTGHVRDKVAVWQGIIDLTVEDFYRTYPGIGSVVFVDFDHFPDEVYLAIAALAKITGSCDVVLNFDPRHSPPGPSPLEPAYQRLYDMAENVEGLGEEDETVPLLALEQRPTLITASNVSEEISACARLLRHRIAAEDSTALPALHVVALANADGYITRMEEALRSNGLSWQYLKGEPLVRGAAFMLLERLAQCVRREVSGDKISDLMRAPGFAGILPLEISTVEAWDLASRLDSILAQTGLLTGWAAVLKGVTAAIKKQHTQRQRTSHWSEEEKMQDDRLQAVLNATYDLAESLSERQDISHWTAVAANLITEAARGGDDPRELIRRGEFIRALDDMAAAAPVVALQPVSFPRFVTLFRTVMQTAREPLDLEAAGRADVILCNPESASYLAGNRLALLGFNDGSCPRFARSDVSFYGSDGPRDQAPYRGRQWHVLSRILSNFTNCELWMPAREGTEPLLPSQFAELLQRKNCVTAVSAEHHLENARCPRENRRDGAEERFVNHLRGLELSSSELAKIRKSAPAAYAAARGISVMASRSAQELSAYDGILRDPQLTRWLANWVDRHTFSVSQLDRIVGCSFRFFADRMLNLDEEERADDLLPAHVFGAFAHDVLARFYRNWVAGGHKVLRSDHERQAREELLRAYHAEGSPDETLSAFARDLMDLKLFGTLGPDGFAADERPLEECGDVGVFGTFLLLEMTRGDARNLDFLQPSNFEVGFGVPPMEDEDPLSTTDCVHMDIGNGHKVRLFGRIDRIDVSPTGVFAVTDYKTGHLPTGPEIAGGFRTQLPIYMMVAQQLLREEYPDAQPAGGLYYSLKRGPAARISGVFVRAAFQGQLGLSGRGMKDEVFTETLAMVKDRIRHSISSLRRGYLTTTQHNPDTVCRYCVYQKLCYRDVERTAAFWEAVETREALAGGMSMETAAPPGGN